MNSVGAKKHNGKRFVHRLNHLSVNDAKPFTDFMKPFLKVSRDEDIERALRNNSEAAERIVKEAVRTGRIWSVPKFRSEDGAHYETGVPIPVGRIRRLTTESVHNERTTMLDQDGKVAAMSMFRYARKHMGMHLTRTDLPAIIATAENSSKALYIEWPVEFLVIAVEPPKAAATPDVIQSLLGRKRPLDTRSESGSSLHSEDSLEIDESEAAAEKPTPSRHEQRKIPK
ncbi:hypothetical protein AAVH_37585, partial [Aphelenchoides avenae]